MKAKIAIPLALVVAAASLVLGFVTGLAFLFVFAAVGLLAAIIGAIWSGRKISGSSG